jgi:hypothetical protein
MSVLDGSPGRNTSPARSAFGAGQRALAWALAASLLASIPSLFVGLSSDDLSQRLILEGNAPGYPKSVFGLYDFTPPHLSAPVLIERGYLPWFTGPELELRFFRPLSSLTLALDAALFGRSAPLAHAQSLLWMLALSLLATLLYRRWFSAPAATLAAVIFAVSGVHGMSVSWLAARHTLIAATFGALALWAIIRYREDGYRRGLLLSLAALACSLLASESGLVAVVLIASYELATAGLARGALRAALPVALGGAYVVGYAALGYGARGSSFYVSPFSAPLAYLRAAFLGVPALGAELMLGLPSVVAGIGGGGALIAFALLGALALGAAFLLQRALGGLLSRDTRRTLGWLSLGGLLGMVALVGAPVSGRVLPLPALAAAAVMGNLLWGAWQRAREQHALRWWLAFGLVALFQLGVSPLARLFMSGQFRKSALDQERVAREADVGACAHGGTLYLINGSDPTLALYAAPILRFHTPEKAGADHLHVLSMAPQRQRLTRVTADTLELSVLEAPRRTNAFEQLFRASDDPLLPGTSIPIAQLGVHVDEASAGVFTRAHFQAPRDLDPTRDCLLAWRNQRLENVPLPRIGESVEIEHEVGPMGL